MPKVLVYTATYGDGLRPETVEAVAAQEFDGEFTHEIGHHNPFPGADARNVTAQYERARGMALNDDYDALLTVEHDIRIPPDCLSKLWATPGQVVYAVYMLRHGSGVLSTWRYQGPTEPGLSLSFHPREVAEYRGRGWGRVAGVGFGCTLIRRPVLGVIRFRDTRRNGPNDIPFMVDCLKRNIVCAGRFDTPCQHYEDGVWLEPYAPGWEWARVYILRDIPLRGLAARQYAGMRLSLAEELQAAGLCRILPLDTGPYGQ